MRAIWLVLLALAVIVPQAAGSWLGTAWTHRRLVTIEPDSVGTGISSYGDIDSGLQSPTIIGIPILIDTLPSAVYDSAAVDGSDIRFTALNGHSIYPHELVYYNAAAESCQIWVRFGSLTPSFAKAWLYYGNSGATMPTPAEQQATFSEMSLAYHFENTPALGRLVDSSPNGWDALAEAAGAQVWDADDRVDGAVQRGWHYNQNVTTTINGPVIPDLDWSLFAWMEMDTFGTDFLLHGKGARGGGGTCYMHVATGASDASHAPQYANDSCSSIGNGIDYRFPEDGTEDDFHHYAFYFTSADSMVTLYKDGIETPVDTFTPTGGRMVPHGLNSAVEKLGVGSTQYTQDGTGSLTDSMHGTVDELWIRTGKFSYYGQPTSNFFKTVYRNQSAPTTFLAVGSEEDCACE